MKNFLLPDLPDQIQKNLGLSLVEESLRINRRAIISDGIFSPKVIEPCFSLLSLISIFIFYFEEASFLLPLTFIIPFAVIYLFVVNFFESLSSGIESITAVNQTLK